MCCWLWTLCHTTQHRAALTIFPLNLRPNENNNKPFCFFYTKRIVFGQILGRETGLLEIERKKTTKNVKKPGLNRIPSHRTLYNWCYYKCSMTVPDAAANTISVSVECCLWSAYRSWEALTDAISQASIIWHHASQRLNTTGRARCRRQRWNRLRHATRHHYSVYTVTLSTTVSEALTIPIRNSTDSATLVLCYLAKW